MGSTAVHNQRASAADPAPAAAHRQQRGSAGPTTRADKKRRSEAMAAANHGRLGRMDTGGLKTAEEQQQQHKRRAKGKGKGKKVADTAQRGTPTADTVNPLTAQHQQKPSKSKVLRKIRKIKASAAKPFQPGWKPRSTTLCRLKGESWRAYARRNKWFVRWLLLALLGLAATLYLYLLPCQPVFKTVSQNVTRFYTANTSATALRNVTRYFTANTTVTTNSTNSSVRTSYSNYTPPSELMVVLDGSGSIGADGWPVEVEAARTFVSAYAAASARGGSPLQAGVVQFSGLGGPGGANAAASKLEVPVTADIPRVLAEMELMKPRSRWLQMATYFAAGLTRAFEAMQNTSYAPDPLAPNGTAPFRGIAFMTDGEPSDPPAGLLYKATDQSGVYLFCKK